MKHNKHQFVVVLIIFHSGIDTEINFTFRKIMTNNLKKENVLFLKKGLFTLLKKYFKNFLQIIYFKMFVFSVIYAICNLSKILYNSD